MDRVNYTNETQLLVCAPLRGFAVVNDVLSLRVMSCGALIQRLTPMARL